MYATSQINPIFEKINALGAASDPAQQASIDEIKAEIKALQDRDQRLILGTHEHRHGYSQYLFLVPRHQAFGEAQFEPFLQEEYEPDREERLNTDTMDEPEVI